MNKTANRCGCTHTHTHTHTSILVNKTGLVFVPKIQTYYANAERVL